MFWVHKGMAIYSRVSDEKAILITIFLGCVYALFLSIPWVLYCRTRANSQLRLMLFPLIWILGEWGRYWLFDGLIWLIQGVGHQSTWLAGWIPVFGALGGSFFCAMTAALIIFLIQNRSRKAVITTSISIALIWLSGGLLSKFDWTQDMGSTIPVVSVQPNRTISFIGRDNVDERNKRWMEELEAASHNHWKSGLLLWPESAIKLKSNDIYTYFDEIDAHAKSSQTAFFTGGPFYPNPENDQHSYNSIYGFGLANGKYHKVHRAPLGEYSPLNGRLAKIIPWFNSTLPPEGFGSTYQPPLTFEFDEQIFYAGPSICYELAFAKLIREQAKQSNLLINVSNDAWFTGTHELDQALQVAQIRALENQKPMIRSTNSGLTAVIDYKGNFVHSAPRDVTALFTSEVRPRSGQTPYSQWGDSPILILATFCVLGVYLRSRKKSM